MQSNNVASKKSNRKTLIIVILIFVLPAIGATLMYTSGWKPGNTINHGELIAPARPIEEKTLQTLDGKPVKFSELQGKWTMVYFDTSTCSEECMNQLYFMRQIHLSQGKDLDRIQRVFIITDTNAADTLKPKLEQYTNMLVLKGDKPVIAKLLQEFGIDEKRASGQHNIFFVDPLGNLMMQYLPGIEPAGMRKDLERLLKYSNNN